ncbi:MAG: AcrB/AcrD/AcrF family protein [Proteobacteria bacterium]|nr:MAG: AcrB/AcrD/AcrF family protein [Pseudomonadota bacterium]QKK12444.1 MAG: efflux RND transporter permease subunit [Pseudomonadota bacterium]
MTFQHKRDMIGRFAQHNVAANLLMLMMVLAGIWALAKLNVQFFPTLELELMTVRVEWSGASAEDVESAITTPLEQELRNLDGVRKLTSSSTTGAAAITIEFEEGTNMGRASDQVNELVARVRDLPDSAEKPEVSQVTRYDRIARLVISGAELDELRPLARRFEDELLARGIARIEVTGLPDEEVAIQIPAARLQELNLRLTDIARTIDAISRDLPAGSMGRDDVARQLRSLDQRRDVLGFERLPIVADDAGQLLTLGDLADIQRRAKPGQPYLRHQGKPAVELELQRVESANALTSAEILHQWLSETRPTLPTNIELTVYDQAWQYIRDRINLLLENGTGGLVLVVAVLFLFLNGRVAFWVALAIPVSFMAALMALYLVGGSINMITLFALIMTLGIIVDDAIVVGEDAMTRYSGGEHSLAAAEGAARRMLAPVMSSSLTTIAAFLPLMLIGGPIGNILFGIPLIVICVILASLTECFLVLPGHLHHSFRRFRHVQSGPTRLRLDAAFAHLRDRYFRPLMTWSVRNRWITLSASVSTMILALGLIIGGRLGFTLFPGVEGTIVYASATFTPGTAARQVDSFLQQLDGSLRATEEALGGNLIQSVTLRSGHGIFGGTDAAAGEHIGSLIVELVEPDVRDIRNRQFVDVWKERIQQPPGLTAFVVAERFMGPPGRDLDIRLVGGDPATLKQAALELSDELQRFPGVGAIEDDMPWGQEQIIYSLLPEGRALGLTIEEAGRQLRAAYDGLTVQIFQQGGHEVEVRVMLPDAERNRLGSLERMMLFLPGGGTVPLTTVLQLDSRRGFEVLRHAEGQLAVQVSGEVDRAANNANRILATLEQEFLPSLASRHGIRYSLEGRAADQAETLGDMKRGMVFALVMIYLVLAWVFGSYTRPLAVMFIIPFGLVGAVFGHWVLGMELTILSLFGFFGLSGIVVNDSIILVTFYQRLREEGMSVQKAVVEAGCQRLRAVLLTSLTTIAGLLPLLFETSVQAQFLIPMAVSITFGLAFATLLVLLVMPALLTVVEDIRRRLTAAPRVTAEQGS